MRSDFVKLVLLVIVFGILGGIGALIMVNSALVTFVVEDVGSSHSTRIVSRIGLPAITVGNGPVSLLAFIPPHARAAGQRDVDWYQSVTQKRAQLTVLKYESAIRFAETVQWIVNGVGNTFVKETGWDPTGPGLESWQVLVEETPDPRAITFREQLDERTRGILIQPSSTGDDALMTFYDYYDGSERQR